MQERTDWATTVENVPSQVCVGVVVNVDLMSVYANHEEHHPHDRGDEKCDAEEQGLMLVGFGIDLARSPVRGDRCVSEKRTHYGWNGGLNAPSESRGCLLRVPAAVVVIGLPMSCPH